MLSLTVPQGSETLRKRRRKEKESELYHSDSFVKPNLYCLLLGSQCNNEDYSVSDFPKTLYTFIGGKITGLIPDCAVKLVIIDLTYGNKMAIP